MKIVLAGGTGFIGTALQDALADGGYHIVLLTRRPDAIAPRPHVDVVPWDGTTIGDWAAQLEGAEAVINLCGADIAARRWSEARKRVLHDSRLLPTHVLTQAVEQAASPPHALLNASAAGYYGTTDREPATERTSPGSDFLAQLCVDWEGTALQAVSDQTRVVLLRLAPVLGAGGLLARMTPAFRAFAGAYPGPGSQPFSWIQRGDAVRAIAFALSQSQIEGPLNLSAPQQVTMRDFGKALGRVLHRPCWGSIPGPVLFALLGELASTLRGGQWARPTKLEEAGFCFEYPQLVSALVHSLGASHDTIGYHRGRTQ